MPADSTPSYTFGYTGRMSDNPYESPLTPPEPDRRWFRKRKPLWHYPLAVVGGLVFLTPLLVPLLAIIDDAGGMQMLIAAGMGPVLYHFLF
jgi:hypothetical protein